MFRIVCDPSSGNIGLYLTEIVRSGSQMFVVCLVCVSQPNFEPVVCVRTYTHTTGSKLRCQTPIKHTTNISEPLRTISVKYSFILPDDGSHTIRNMSEWSSILCLLKFLYIHICKCIYISICIYIYLYIQDVPGGMDKTSGECSLC